MEKKKESFIIYHSFYGPIRNLSDLQMGQLFRGIFEWQIEGKEIDQDSEVFMAFQFFKNQFEIDLKKYQKVCEKRSEAASKRWDDASDANASKRNQKHSKDADNDNEKEKEIDNGIDNGKEKDNEIVNPFSDSFLPYWQKWLQYKKDEHRFRYRSISSQQTALNGLHQLAKGNEEMAIRIMNQSVINGWKGFFELKKDQSNPGAAQNLGVSEDYINQLKNRINGGNN